MSLISAELLEILRCIECKEQLSEDAEASELRCENGHTFSVVDGIPNMLPSQ
jgi:uncharacterized protein YbaR (Trm112 family)